jgi:predicted DCC family thiol-disulfide oxidoreductase YuxK
MGVGVRDKVPESIVLVDKGKIYFRSAAALRIVRGLKSLWPLLYFFIVVPKFLRDPVYNVLAKNRYKWFGKRNTCYVPGRDSSHKFIDEKTGS